VTALAAILTAIVELLKQWRDAALKTWQKEGDDVSKELSEVKTDDDAKKASDDLESHISKLP
jgi:gas vesicle protein